MAAVIMISKSIGRTLNDFKAAAFLSFPTPSGATASFFFHNDAIGNAPKVVLQACSFFYNHVICSSRSISLLPQTRQQYPLDPQLQATSIPNREPWLQPTQASL